MGLNWFEIDLDKSLSYFFFSSGKLAFCAPGRWVSQRWILMDSYGGFVIVILNVVLFNGDVRNLRVKGLHMAIVVGINEEGLHLYEPRDYVGSI
jgi:hypothetical protein